MKPCPYCGEDLDEVAITVGTLNAPQSRFVSWPRAGLSHREM